MTGVMKCLADECPPADLTAAQDAIRTNCRVFVCSFLFPIHVHLLILFPFLFSFGRASEPSEAVGPGHHPQLQLVQVLPVLAAPLRHGKSPPLVLL